MKEVPPVVDKNGEHTEVQAKPRSAYFFLKQTTVVMITILVGFYTMGSLSSHYILS